MNCLFLISVVCLSVSQAASAEPIQLQSEGTQTPLLELYTSEGCSSCPPAEAWLSRLKESPKLWRDFVPVAFHVDYWDNLGWKDPYAKESHSERQRQYAEQWRSHSVYTPGFVLDGTEWRGWVESNELPRPSGKAGGTLSAKSEDGKTWVLEFKPGAGGVAPREFHAALLGFNSVIEVKAGENSGRKLKHDFVALKVADAPVKRDGEVSRATLSLDLKTVAQPGRRAVAIWITGSDGLRPLQALGGWVGGTEKSKQNE